jgi:hypothetical protein
VSRHAARRAEASQRVIYAEDRCGLRWPLVLQGMLMPVVVAALIAAVFVTDEGIWAILMAIAAFWGMYMTLGLIRSWPISIRIDAEGIRIGGCRAQERRQRSGRWPPRKPFHVGAQGRAVFTCPWEGVRSLYLITDHDEIKPLFKQFRTFQKRSDGLRLPLGFLGVPFFKAGLVITNNPAFTRSDPSEFRTNWRQYGRIRGVGSPTWMVPTRRPAELRAALQQCPWAPPVEDHLPPNAEFQFYSP